MFVVYGYLFTNTDSGKLLGPRDSDFDWSQYSVTSLPEDQQEFLFDNCDMQQVGPDLVLFHKDSMYTFVHPFKYNRVKALRAGRLFEEEMEESLKILNKSNPAEGCGWLVMGRDNGEH